jgi:hypothetical protein
VIKVYYTNREKIKIKNNYHASKKFSENKRFQEVGPEAPSSFLLAKKQVIDLD